MVHSLRIIVGTQETKFGLHSFTLPSFEAVEIVLHQYALAYPDARVYYKRVSQ